MYNIHNLTNVQLNYLKKNINCKSIDITKIRKNKVWTDCLSIITWHNNNILITKNNYRNVYEAIVILKNRVVQVPVVSSTMVNEIKNAFNVPKSKNYYKSIMRNIEREYETEPNGLVMNLTNRADKQYHNAEEHLLE